MQAGEPGSPGNECAQTSATPVTAHYSLCRYGKPTASPKATGLRGATAKGVRLRRLSRRRLEQDGSAHTPDSRDHPTGRLCGGGGGGRAHCRAGKVDARGMRVSLPTTTCVRAHACTLTHMHTCADTYSCTHTHMHLHTCTLVHGHV